MSIFLFLLVLFVLVLVHEWGHYITAKKTGMRVDEFAIGFPPRLFGIKRGETDFNFNLLPIGGYVKIYGENAEEDGQERELADIGRAFHERPKWAQAIVLVAGITMNILFAWLLFTIVFILGVPTAVEDSQATDASQLIVAGTVEGAPAEGVLPVGSVIVRAEAGGEVLTSPTPSSFSVFVSENAPEPIQVTYELDEEQTVVSLTPKTGFVDADPEKYVVGASLSLIEVRKESIVGAIIEGFKMTVNGVVSITVGLGTLIKESIIGEADFSNIAGPVGIVGMVGDAASYGLTPLLMFTAIISLNLAVVNLLPFPALDGGRLVFVAVEAITKRRVPARVTGWVNLLGFVLLMLLMAAVTFNDISRLF
jgi:regulator of sigma E protease